MMWMMFGCVVMVWITAFSLEIGRICEWLSAEDV